MGDIKDIIDLVKDLESRAKERKDIETLSKIMSEIREVQGQMFDIRERNIELKEENANLKQKLEAKDEEEIRIYKEVEFRRGRRTGGTWSAFCPLCHMPARMTIGRSDIRCTGICHWVLYQHEGIDEMLGQLNSKTPPTSSESRP